MIWVIVIGIIGFILFRFFMDFNKDNYDLKGRGQVIPLDKRSFNLYENGNILWKNEHGDREHQQTVRNIFPYKQGYMLSGRTLHIATNKQDSWIVFVDKV